MRLKLTADDQAMLAGEAGAGVAMAMRIVVGLAKASGAKELLTISMAHIDGCLYNGQASLDFAQRLAGLGATVRVPTTLNVSSLDLLHPELIRSDPTTQAGARQLTDAYLAIGAQPTWTCAPYQLAVRPRFGQHIAWAESNAIVFANSVIGARTARYGDFIDAAAAITGRAPATGLHLDENRRAGVVFDVSSLSERLRQRDSFYAVFGLLIGSRSGSRVPAVTGLDGCTEDQLKIMGAAAATTGSVGLMHIVGVTPEAPTLDAVGGSTLDHISVSPLMLTDARDRLNGASIGDPLGSISLGTPHYSRDQLQTLLDLLEGEPIKTAMFVNTGRNVLDDWGRTDELADLGVTVITDTCTYVTTIIDPRDGATMTDSAKWAYYAPGNLGVTAAFGSLEECVRSAIAGHIVRIDDEWN